MLRRNVTLNAAPYITELYSKNTSPRKLVLVEVESFIFRFAVMQRISVTENSFR